MQQNKTKDFFLNLGVTVSLYILVGSLLSLLFTVINRAYPKITNAYAYTVSDSISWPVAVLIILTPVFLGLMWFVSKDYAIDPERKNSLVHKFLTYLTLFLAGGFLIGDLVTVLYYFLDGQELSTAFLLKVLSIIVVAGSIFTYYIGDVRGTLTPQKRMFWRVFAIVLVLGSIVWGFSVLGSPYTQRMYKYDSQKVSDLSNIKSAVESYYSVNNSLPENLTQMKDGGNYYYFTDIDSQSGKAYEYKKLSALQYEICAEFNKETEKNTSSVNSYEYMGYSWEHPAGRHCFEITINPNLYTKPVPVR